MFHKNFLKKVVEFSNFNFQNNIMSLERKMYFYFNILIMLFKKFPNKGIKKIFEFIYFYFIIKTNKYIQLI